MGKKMHKIKKGGENDKLRPSFYLLGDGTMSHLPFDMLKL